MKTIHVTKAHCGVLWTVAAMALLVTGCNSGSGSGANLSENGVSFGRITGFGSVFVNGTRFNTDDAVIMVNGMTAIQDDLAEGMLIRVEGRWDDSGQGVAERIEYTDDIRGPVQNVQLDPSTGTGILEIAGQVVEINTQTVFAGMTDDSLTPGQYLGLSGWHRLDDSSYLASMVMQSNPAAFPDGRQVEIKGIIADLDIGARTFRIGGLVVDYGNARIEMENDRRVLQPGDEGRFVEVEGRIQGDVLIASEVEREDGGRRVSAGTGSGSGFEIKYEGPISQVGEGGVTFIIHGVTVRITGQTRFDDGLRLSDLVPGLHVEVEGRLNQAGELVAREIEPRSGGAWRDGAQAEVKGRVEAVASSSFTIHGLIVHVNGQTEWDDGLRGIGDLTPGRCIEVEYRLIDGVAVAREVEGDDDCR